MNNIKKNKYDEQDYWENESTCHEVGISGGCNSYCPVLSRLECKSFDEDSLEALKDSTNENKEELIEEYTHIVELNRIKFNDSDGVPSWLDCKAIAIIPITGTPVNGYSFIVAGTIELDSEYYNWDREEVLITSKEPPRLQINVSSLMGLNTPYRKQIKGRYYDFKGKWSTDEIKLKLTQGCRWYNTRSPYNIELVDDIESVDDVQETKFDIELGE